ncbi:MAG: hypothetical protein GEV07_17505 [Streptosporangiales bacterium]|nr:hypothetical protein [Streptosporangiales bacterium]
MSRPRFWLLSAVALQLGFVLATHRLLPRGPEIVAMAHAAVVAGPLLWLAVLSVNDARDLAGDRLNPRKADTPLVRGRITPRAAVRIGAVASVAAVLAAVPLGAPFALGTAVAVLLGWAYSMPPLRLKARVGADVLVNSCAVGLLGPLGGWVAVTGTVAGFPWPMGVVGVLAVAGLYLPTTLVDHGADRRVGVRTTAVVLGRRATFELGFALWTASAVVTFVLAAGDVVIDRSLLPAHLVLTPMLLVLYRMVLRGRPSFPAVMAVAGAYLLPCAMFVATYVESI